ncbi:MAG: pyridoxine 5'-phosphate synthase [Acidiferrobacterales bacterium]|nr:pyridoxine 5'-phosphate synthase [Acidiferrobacterales bacterium]
MTKLSINLNKIALLRNARGMNFPKVLDFAQLCAANGADGLTVHPRPDQRHATYEDVKDLAEFCSQYPGVEFNVEGYPTADFLEVVRSARPDQCTLVPDAPDQITSDHGWNTLAEIHFLRPVISELKHHGVRTSIFLDPDVGLIDSAAQTGADRIELYTEEYARTYDSDDNADVLDRYRQTADAAQNAGLGVNAGHDLNQRNLARFLTIPNVLEVSIGHALTVESLLEGFEPTLRSYVSIIESCNN